MTHGGFLLYLAANSDAIQHNNNSSYNKNNNSNNNNNNNEKSYNKCSLIGARVEEVSYREAPEEIAKMLESKMSVLNLTARHATSGRQQ